MVRRGQCDRLLENYLTTEGCSGVLEHFIMHTPSNDMDRYCMYEVVSSIGWFSMKYDLNERRSYVNEDSEIHRMLHKIGRQLVIGSVEKVVN